MQVKQGISELQARLSQRLQSTHEASSAVASWLAVEAGAQHYLLSLNLAGEIFPWTPPQVTPYTQDWFLGVANLRGMLCGVVSLAGFLRRHSGGDQKAHSLSEPGLQAQTAVPNMSDKRLIGLHAGFEINTVLLVDGLLGLKNVNHFKQHVESQAKDAAYLGGRYTDAQGQVWQEIDLKCLASTKIF